MIALLTGLLVSFSGTPLSAAPHPAPQTPPGYAGRLSVVPVDARSARTTSGSGRVTATVDGGRLRIQGTFQGTYSPVTGAELFEAPPGQRGGPLVARLNATADTTGKIEGSVELTDSLRSALRRGGLYVLVTTGGNPDGEIRGWLLPPGWTGIDDGSESGR